MNITIPIYVERLSPKGEQAQTYALRPLFFPEPQVRGEDLNRAMGKLARAIRKECDRLGRQMRHEDLARYSFSPTLEDHFLKITLALSGRTAKCRFLVVAFESLNRKLAFTPSLPDLWFEIDRGETLTDRAVEALTRYFRHKEKKDGKNAPRPEQLSVEGKAWVTTLELDIHPPGIAVPPKESLFAALGGQEVLDGASELESVGRCLDHLYPDDLSRAIYRDREADELSRLLTGPDKRPTLLIGPRMVGKTSIIHEYVYRTVHKRRSPYTSKNNVWLLSPQRLISGMSYVGQWENRLLAILEEAKKRDHTLYFDDLLGLFHAGQSSDSSLSVADVLRPYVEKREFRILAEITPEAFRVLQEKDRGFADLFHPLPIKEPGEDETFRILISLMRRLESAHRCRFAIDVFSTVLDIQRRYVRDTVFPGKAAVFFERLAVKHRGSKVTRENVLEEFHAKSGLAISFLNSQAKLDRREVIEALGREVIGQPAAIEACADVVSIAKARLNDTARPLASFLFLGPTGVGKTQCAKSLAAYLFGDADKILRFDMNEYSSARSTARLVGTFDQPEGLLTSAVRREPFSVVLLDEIEKAHPDVFNMLLQVMGDGRLTDALGRTVDFTNAILIMTSNLGVKEAGGNIGFRHDGSTEAAVYVQAAEKFFKPEFFNRLDRIVPFERLTRGDVQKIARQLIQGVFARDGLIRRRCVLQVDERAMGRIVDQGYAPLLGARALKRALERQLTQPVARQLVSIRPDAPTIVSVYPSGDDLSVIVEGLTGVEPDYSLASLLEVSEPKAVLKQVESAVGRIEEGASRVRPDGLIIPEEIRPEQFAYFLVKEQARRIRDLCRRAEERLASPRAKLVSRTKGRRLTAGQLTIRQASAKDLWNGAVAAQNVHGYLRELANNSPAHGERIEDHLADVIRETSFLEMIAQPDGGLSFDRAVMFIRSLDQSHEPEQSLLSKLYAKLFGNQFGMEVQLLKDPEKDLTGEALVIKGAHALSLAKREEGTHLFYPAYKNFVPIQVGVLPIHDDALTTLRQHIGGRQRWLDDLAAGNSSGDGPFRLLPVIRIYEEQGVTLDLRSGLMTLKTPTASEMRAFLLAGLPLPQELGSGS